MPESNERQQFFCYQLEHLRMPERTMYIQRPRSLQKYCKCPAFRTTERKDFPLLG